LLLHPPDESTWILAGLDAVEVADPNPELCLGAAKSERLGHSWLPDGDAVR
jgi:hypothetical protein